jgi:peptidoglycan hydrolase-like protein with peptidoglycan-binding domain
MTWMRLVIFLPFFSCAAVPAIADSEDSKKQERLEQSTIEQAQKKLNQFDYELVEDGILGFQTRNAISKFQQNHNLAPNGRLDQKTLQALGVEDDGHVGVPTAMNPNDLTRTTSKDKEIENSKQKESSNE